jgi:OOP family OmpA-OmpF porin
MFRRGFKMKKIVVALLVATAAVSAAQAQTIQSTPGGYIGLGAASANSNSSTNGLNATDNDGYKSNVKVFGGYDFNSMWGAEAGYTDFRNSGFNYNVAGVNGRGNTDGYSYYVAGKAMMPVNDQFGVYGKLGVEHSQRSLKDVGVYNASNSDTGVYAGVGLQYNFTPKTAVVAEYERYGKEKDFGARPNVWTIGARYSF